MPENKRRRNKKKARSGGREDVLEPAIPFLHVCLIGAYLLYCGAYQARAGSERLLHGTEDQRISPAQVAEWIDEKIDLLFYRYNGRIEP